MKRKLRLFSVIMLLAAGCMNQQSQPNIPKMTETQTSVSAATITPSLKPTGTAFNTYTPTAKSLPENNSDNLPSSTNTPTRTPTIRPGISPSATPVNTLEAHEWFPDNPIVVYDSQGGDGCCQYPNPPIFILYSDGRLFLRKYASENNAYQVLSKTLTRTEMCAFLNTIDQLGFFDYDPSTYQKDRYGREINHFPMDGSSIINISVNAWRSQSVSLYGLASFLWEEEMFANWPEDDISQPPTILPALKNTFLFLSSYKPDDLQRYQPEALEIWISDETYSTEDIKQWPIKEPSLAYLIENAQPDDFYEKSKLIIEGTQAQNVFEALSYAIREEEFTDGKNAVTLFALPMLPDSTVTQRYPTPTPVLLSCTPADGQVSWSP